MIKMFSFLLCLVPIAALAEEGTRVGGPISGTVFDRKSGALRPMLAKDVDCFIPHQANKRIMTATAERLGLRAEAPIINIDRFGNTTAATVPLAMQTAIDEGKLKKGSLVLLASVGAGFTTGATLLRWAY